MTFNQIILKIFKANLRRYLLYLLCSSFSIIVFFTYSTIYTNKKFMDSKITDSMISSGIIAPGIGVILFSIFFIIYTQNSFIKFRKTEFGLFMVLGMTSHNIRKIIIIENSLIAVFSLLIGIVTGNVFSKVFYKITIMLTKIKDVPYSINSKSYLYTIGFFIAIYAVVITKASIATIRYNIVTLLKSNRRKEKNLLNGPVWSVIGIVLVCIAILDMNFNYNINSSFILIRSLSVCFLGVFLIITNTDFLISIVNGFFPKKRLKNVIFITNLKYTLGCTKKILFLITLLTSITILFGSFGLDFIKVSKKYAIMNNPYHMAYAEVLGKNKIPQDLLNNILKESKTPLTTLKKLEFIKEPYPYSLSLLSDKNLNYNLHTNIKVKKGHFISLFQIINNDGYLHDTNEKNKIEFVVNNRKFNYNIQGSLKEVLFGTIPIVESERVYILNDNDFKVLKENEVHNRIGTITLMNFKDWYKIEEVYDKLSNVLNKFNKSSTEPIYDENAERILFNPISRIEDFNSRNRSGSFLLFILFFIGLLFFVSSTTLLHFKLQTEFENEKAKYRKLYKIGITYIEASRVIKKEIKLLFFLPLTLAVLISSFYFRSLTINNLGSTNIECSLIISFIYLCFQFALYLLYQQVYVKSLLSVSKSV